MSKLDSIIERRVRERLRKFMEVAVREQKEAMRTDVVEFWTSQAPRLAQPLQKIWKEYCQVLDKRLAELDVSATALHEANKLEKAMARRIAHLLHEHGIKSGQIFEAACQMADRRLVKGLEALRRLNGKIDHIRLTAH